jgi:hypothetical protein
MAETRAGTKKTTKAPATSRARATKQAPQITAEEIAARAYEISQSDAAGSEEQNWLRAEQELHGRTAEVAP